MTTRHSDASFDRALRRSLAVAPNGAADVEEVLDVARRVAAGDVAGWEREWQQIADRALDAGDELLAADDPAGAGRAFLRAAEYYRQAGVFSDNESRHALDMAHVNAFRAAMPLLPVLAEIVEIDASIGMDGLRGYLFRLPGEPNRPLALALVCADSTAEAGYAEVAVPVLEQGLNCLILDSWHEHRALRWSAADRHRARAAAVRWIRDRTDLNHRQLLVLLAT